MTEEAEEVDWVQCDLCDKWQEVRARVGAKATSQGSECSNDPRQLPTLAA